MSARYRTDLLLLLGFCAFLFFFGLGYFGLVGADEPRYAQVAREMLARHDWVTPTLGGRAWLEKPVLYYWQAMLAYAAFGVGEWTARMPSALDATAMVLAVYFFLLRFRSGYQFDGALITASCAGIIGFARAAATDMPLAAAFGISMLAWYAWFESGERKYLAGFYAFQAAAVLAKGPVAPALAAMVIALFLFVRRDLRSLRRTLWTPGLLVFCALALPWYVAVQWRNPEFFRVFILEHNLARFSTNLYRHAQPFWYYVPVLLLAMLPWTVFVFRSAGHLARAWRAERRTLLEGEDAFDVFCLLWLLIPVLFFSLSQSKLPGYILPAIPAGALLVSEYVRRRLEDAPGGRDSSLLFGLHALAAAAPIVPAVMINYLVLQRRLPWGTAAAIAVGAALLIAGGIFTTLKTAGLRMLRFVTLVPVVMAVAIALRIGAPVVDATQSARPLARQVAALEGRPLPLAVYGVPRQVEYGLAFYRDQPVASYDRGEVPGGEHLLVAPEGKLAQVTSRVPGRRVARLGSFLPQHLDYYWVAGSAASR